MTTNNTQPAAEEQNGVQRFDKWLAGDMTAKRALTVYGVIGLYFVFLLLPILFMLVTTVASEGFLYSDRILPSLGELTLSNYQTVITRGQFQQYFINSVIVAVSTTVVTLVIGTLAGYSLSRFNFPGKQAILVGYLSTQMLPYVLILIPFFLLMFNLQLIDSLLGIVLAHSVITLPFAVWLLKGYFDDIPRSLDEAAKMDGCSHVDILTRVILPLSIPGLAVAGFYAFVISWNDFLFVSILSQTSATRTLPFGLQLFQAQNTVNWELLLCAATITMAPPIILFSLIQRWVIEGLASGGLKGM